MGRWVAMVDSGELLLRNGAWITPQYHLERQAHGAPPVAVWVFPTRAAVRGVLRDWLPWARPLRVWP